MVHAEKRIVLEGLLAENDEALQAWEKLKKKLPGEDLNSVSYHLEAIANRKKSFPWRPATPKQARRFADRLERDAERTEHMTLHYGALIPLADPALTNLPATLRLYAQALRDAAQKRPKSRPPDDFTEREIEILRLIEQQEAYRVRHYFREAADLIQAAYNAAGLNRIVNVEQLRMLYERQSLSYRLRQQAKKSSPDAR